MRVSFHPDGTVRDIGESGDHPLPGESLLALRYRLIDGQSVDLYSGMTDEAVLARILKEEERQQETMQKAE